MDFEQLVQKIREYLPEEKLAIINDAYLFASKAHVEQLRESGEPYIEHPLQTAFILAELQLDASTLAAALLHDVPENCDIPILEIEAKFGPEIAKLVDGTTKLAKLSQPEEAITATESNMENLRKMLVAMAEDLRVVFIKLADRLHNMRTLDALPPDKQKNISQETMDIFAPLAHRLGIWELKWQLEDLSFSYLQPNKYKQISNMIAPRRVQRENFISHVIQTIKKEFDRVGLIADISGRPKHFYSIYQKMERYAAIGKHFNDIHDLLALRILVGTVPDCYNAVGIIHSLWHPIPGEFDDYIANPKTNGYQSLHTSVMCLGTTPLEIQIRTREMHYFSEYGIAAHWRYKEGETRDLHFEDKIAWLRQLIEWHRELRGAEEFLESVKTDVFIDQVFVYTPKGEIKDLPKGSTPLDLAYRIHTDLGHNCVGAKVNGRLMPLNYQLVNGDVVEIITTKKGKGPSRDWLSPHLGYTKTSHSRQKIRQWFKIQEKSENIERGREILEKELRLLGIKLNERGEIAKLFKYDNLDDFLEAIGYGGVTTHQIALKLAAEQEQPDIETEITPSKSRPTMRVMGVENVVTNLAQCCHPVPGDKIIGYITRNRGVTIHCQDCYNVIHEDEKERLVPVEWVESDSSYPVNIKIEAWDRVGLIRDITSVVAEEKVNITGVSSAHHDDHTFTILLTLETKGLAQLSRLLAKINSVRGIISVTRIRSKTNTKPNISEEINATQQIKPKTGTRI